MMFMVARGVSGLWCNVGIAAEAIPWGVHPFYFAAAGMGEGSKCLA